MAKGHKTTMRFPKHLRRSSEAPHVKAWRAYRARKGKPKAKLSPTRNAPLTLQRYHTLMDDYARKASEDLHEKVEKRRALEREKPGAFSLEIFTQFIKKDLQALALFYKRFGTATVGATLTNPSRIYPMVNEIIGDFRDRGTRGLRVFDFGAGYAPLLFFLRNFMGAKVRGVELGSFSEAFTKAHRLGVIHGKSVDNPTLRRLGKFDVTCSTIVLERDVIDKKIALGMLDNMAAMTKKGGKSYHLVLFEHYVPISKAEIEERGFRIDKWEKTRVGDLLIKLTKIRD